MLGEIPDEEAALRELDRVVRPRGRIVVGGRLGYFATFTAVRPDGAAGRG